VKLTALRETLDRQGPFASIHLDASHDTEDAAKLAELRWRAIRDQLEAHEAPEPTLDALDEALAQPPPAGRAGRLLVAAGNEVLVDEYLPAPPAQPMVRLSSLPYLLPLADWSRRGVPHVVVTVDHTGAGLRAVDGDGAPREEHVSGPGEVAEQTVRLVREVGAQLLVLAGDVEARARLRAALPQACQRIAVDASDDDLGVLLARRRQDEHDQVLERFRTASGHGLAVQGLRDTTGALREGNVEVLLIDARAVAAATVLTGTGPTMVGVDREDLHRVGVSERQESPADEALPAAALASGADVIAASGDEPPLELADGVGALLRHT
jgi:ribosomal protein L7Ae-like RNA K-turn-binding protein